MAAIDLRDVRKVYAGGIEAVKGVSLFVPDGSFCVLVGPSGCGKSTLLRMIAGLETVSSGEIAIGGSVVNGIEPADRDIAMVFQNYALYPHMTVYDNIAYGLRNRGVVRADIDRLVRQAARMLDIEVLLDRRPRALSGGQRQRVAMGRAIVRHPRAFLFDEPLSNLDAKLRVQMRVEIRNLQRTLGITSVYVTHDQVEAMTLSDLLVVLNAGRIEQAGTPDEIYARPATRFVATFIGLPPMNIVPGIVGESGEILVGGHVVGRASSLNPGAVVDVGLRPEDAKVCASVGRGIPLDLSISENLGASRLLHGRMAGAPFIAEIPSAASFTVPGRVEIDASAGSLHLFDRADGRRLGYVEPPGERHPA